MGLLLTCGLCGRQADGTYFGPRPPPADGAYAELKDTEEASELYSA